jgi:hypothetical protein
VIRQRQSEQGDQIEVIRPRRSDRGNPTKAIKSKGLECSYKVTAKKASPKEPKKFGTVLALFWHCLKALEKRKSLETCWEKALGSWKIPRKRKTH